MRAKTFSLFDVRCERERPDAAVRPVHNNALRFFPFPIVCQVRGYFRTNYFLQKHFVGHFDGCARPIALANRTDVVLLYKLVLHGTFFSYMIYSHSTASLLTDPDSTLFLPNKLLNLLLHILDIVWPAFDSPHNFTHDGSIRPLGLLESSDCLINNAVQLLLRHLGDILGVLLQHIQLRLLLLDQIRALGSSAFLYRSVRCLDLLLDQRVKCAVVLDRFRSLRGVDDFGLE